MCLLEVTNSELVGLGNGYTLVKKHDYSNCIKLRWLSLTFVNYFCESPPFIHFIVLTMCFIEVPHLRDFDSQNSTLQPEKHLGWESGLNQGEHIMLAIRTQQYTVIYIINARMVDIMAQVQQLSNEQCYVAFATVHIYPQHCLKVKSITTIPLHHLLLSFTSFTLHQLQNCLHNTSSCTQDIPRLYQSSFCLDTC